MNLFSEEKNKKEKFEQGSKYALHRGKLSPKELDSYDDNGWQLVAPIVLGNDTVGYYFRRK